MKIHAIARDGMGVPENKADYIVGPWLNFDSETEKFVGDRSAEANQLLSDPHNPDFNIPAAQSV